MGSEWRTVRLGDHVEACLGKMLDQNKNQGTLHPYLGNKQVRWGSFDLGDLSEMKFGDHEHERYGLRYGDLVVCEGGEPGRCALWKDEVQDMKIQKALHRIRPNPELNSTFLNYWFCYAGKFDLLEPYFTGTTIQHLTGKAIAELPIPLPPLPEQKAIAHILGSLDDKIELNRRMNATLEGMAQALFKSWFVDFDPVIDNALAAGNPIPDELADRAEVRRQALANGTANREAAKPFPAAFQQTASMGWIPEGWESKEIGDFVEIKHGYAFKGEYFTSERTDDILVTPGNFRIGGGFKSDKLKFYDGPTAEDYVLQPKDLIVTMTDLSKAGDTLGYPAFVPPSDRLTYHHNQRVGLVNLKTQGIGKNYLYQIFKSTAYRDEILGSMSGSTVKHTSPSKISAFKFPFSGGGGALELVLEEESEAIEAKITLNNSASESLTKLRDTLLPKLISGALRTSESEQLTEEALT